MQHCQIRSDRETTPRGAWRPQEDRTTYPVPPMPLQASPQSRSTRGCDLQEAHIGRQAQDLDGSFSSCRVAPSSVLRQKQTESLGEKAPLEHFALEGETTKLRVPPPNPEQLDNDKLELDEFEQNSCTHRGQLRRALRAMHQAVHSLAANLDGQQRPTSNENNNNNNNNNNNHTNNHNNNTTNNNNNNEPNHYNNNNQSSRESGLNSLDLDNDNPESDPDLDSRSLFSFNPLVGVESRLGSDDQQEAEQSFSDIGETMTIGFSFRSLTQEGEMIGTTWDRSLETPDPSLSQLRDKKPQKQVSFNEHNLACNELWQNNRKQRYNNLCPQNVPCPKGCAPLDLSKKWISAPPGNWEKMAIFDRSLGHFPPFPRAHIPCFGLFPHFRPGLYPQTKRQ